MRYTVKARYGNQEMDVREFVLPKGVMVSQVLEEISAVDSPDDLIWRCWDWVCREIQYPPLPLASADYHREEAFLRGSSAPWVGFMPIRHSTKWEFWQLPFETIDHRLGDCDDVAVLLCSLLRVILPADEVHVTMGRVFPYYHAWVTLARGGERYVLEPTLDRASPGNPYQVAEAAPYEPLLYFNDEQAFEVNGGLEEMKSALREDEVKMGLLRNAYRQVGGEEEEPTYKGLVIMGVCIGLAGTTALVIREMLKKK